jgi:hypothetical protein
MHQEYRGNIALGQSASVEAVAARNSQRKIPRAARALLPFHGVVTWPLADGGEIAFAHPLVKAHPGRRKSAKSAEANPVTLQTESRDFAAVEEK